MASCGMGTYYVQCLLRDPAVEMKLRMGVPLLWVRDAMARHPRGPRAMKAALATVLAWMIVQPMGGVADEYPYYAPLGAVIAVSTTVADSVRSSLRSVGAIFLGATLAVGVGPLLPGPIALAVVVLVGTLLAGWWRLGDMGTWVPISALFVLIIGHLDTGDFVLGYLGLTGLGAGVGVAVNAALPPLPLTPGAYQIAAVRRSVAAQLEDLADALRHEDPLSDDEWTRRYHGIRPHAVAMARLVTQTAEARRANWREHRWRRSAEQLAVHARALERLSVVVDDLAMLLVDTRHDVADAYATGAELRQAAADALKSVAIILRADETEPDPETRSAAEAAVTRYVEVVHERDRGADADLVTAGAIATALRQVVASLSFPDGQH